MTRRWPICLAMWAGLILVVVTSMPSTADRRAGPGRAPAVATMPSLDPNADLAALKSLFRRPAAPAPPVAPDLAALGARLFNDPRLSSDHRLSCASCHVPERGFIDGRRRARGLAGRQLSRNTPALWNLAPATAFYWDGRAKSLEQQVEDAVERDGEMDSTLKAAIHWLASDPTYPPAFQRAGLPVEPASIAMAVAAYQRTLVSPVTRFDRWIEGDSTALSPREIAGFRVFTGPGRCIACHGGWRLTDDRLHDIGLRTSARITAGGERRMDFKTPSLREVRWTAPYFHDGRTRRLSQVMAHYARRIQRRPTLAPILRTPLQLTRRERADLTAFLRTVSSEQRPRP